MRYIAAPIGWLQFWTFTVLGILFFAFLIRAIVRRPKEAGDGKREAKSRNGIILQSVAFFIAGFGGVRLALPLFSPVAIAGTAAVVVLMSGAMYLFAASSGALGKNWSFEARTLTDHQLIRTGPYARVRHPIYLGMFLFLLGMAVALGHWLALIVAVPLFIVGTSIRTRLEDRLLEAQFGDEFRAYAASTPALIPKLG